MIMAYTEAFRRSLKFSALIGGVDLVAALVSGLDGFSPSETLGDLLLVEVAVLFILAGILDVGSSIGMAQLRRVVLASKEDFSSQNRKLAERRVMIVLFTGLILLTVMILLAVVDIFSRSIPSAQ